MLKSYPESKRGEEEKEDFFFETSWVDLFHRGKTNPHSQNDIWGLRLL